jgi:hypothetical protein
MEGNRLPTYNYFSSYASHESARPNNFMLNFGQSTFSSDQNKTINDKLDCLNSRLSTL